MDLKAIKRDEALAEAYNGTDGEVIAIDEASKMKDDIYVVFRGGLFIGFQRAKSPKDAKKKASVEADLSNYSSGHNRHSRRAAGHTMRARKVTPEELRLAGYNVNLESLDVPGSAARVAGAN